MYLENYHHGLKNHLTIPKNMSLFLVPKYCL
nr:MAG TPA: hypothetical protein [Caudoviricetes sp.]